MTPPADPPPEPAPLPWSWSPAGPRAGTPPAVLAQLHDTVQGLLVGDGRNGRLEGRLELKGEVLPGVSVSIAQVEGRLEVDFTCSVERSRLFLTQALPELARTLAERLQTAVLVRVQTDDEEDPCLVEELAGT